MKTYYDEISAIAGNVVTVKAQGIGYDELAVITAAHGSSLAQVIRIEDEDLGCGTHVVDLFEPAS